MNYYNKFFNISTENWESEAIKSLKEDGVIIFSGIVNKSQNESINRKTSLILLKPFLLGGVGYYQKDILKKTYDGFLMGKDVVESVLNQFKQKAA